MDQDTEVHPPAGAAGSHNGTPRDPSQAAAQLLEMAARDAEQWRSEAQAEASSLVDEARAEADRLVQAGREEAEALVSAARGEAERVQAEQDETARAHRAEVTELRRLASEHRGHLRKHLNDLLQRVDGAPHDGDRPQTD